MRNITIVGASLAGYRAAQTLRRDGFDGTVTLVGDEPHRPYDRPPLSKKVLSGAAEPDSIALERDGDDLDVDWRLGERAVGFDADSRTVRLGGGDELSSDGVILACGARPRSLPGTDGLDGMHLLRTLDDSLALREAFESRPSRVVVIGAGFIGAEVAATARGMGLDVTLVEALDLPLARVLPPMIGELSAAVHRDHGVDLRLGVGVDGLESGDDDRVRAVRLADGSQIEADVVVVGIGVVPNTGWLEGSGLTLDNGVVCDETTLAAPGIVAAGDVARWPNPLFDEVMRIEHWDNAVAMGQHAARRLLAGDGPGEPFAPVPYFWTDQYDTKLQLVGRAGPDDAVEVVDGSLDERRFVAIIGRGDRLVGAVGMNRPPAVMRWQSRIAERMSWDEALALAE
ncbi:MAG: FAD-dependent oxidoreductase [Acidimicrobiales bacterium]|nr:FAD-dependent oxidoreductase [Acidimicrobiales bacterium]